MIVAVDFTFQGS